MGVTGWVEGGGGERRVGGGETCGAYGGAGLCPRRGWRGCGRASVGRVYPPEADDPKAVGPPVATLPQSRLAAVRCAQ